MITILSLNKIESVTCYAITSQLAPKSYKYALTIDLLFKDRFL